MFSRWFETQTEEKRPRRPPNKAKRASTISQPPLPRFTVRRSGAEHTAPDCCRDPAEEITKGELQISPSVLKPWFIVWSLAAGAAETQQSYFRRGSLCFAAKGGSSIPGVASALSAHFCMCIVFGQSCNTKCMIVAFM